MLSFHHNRNDIVVILPLPQPQCGCSRSTTATTFSKRSCSTYATTAMQLLEFYQSPCLSCLQCLHLKCVSLIAAKWMRAVRDMPRANQNTNGAIFEVEDINLLRL